MGRAAPCEPCNTAGACTQYGPITNWDSDEWDVTITKALDPLTTASINWGSDLEVTATIGTTSLPDVDDDRGVTVVLRSKTMTYRHYRHHAPISQFTARCELELTTDPAYRSEMPYVRVRLVTAAGSVIGGVQWFNIYDQPLTRRAMSSVSGAAVAECGPAWIDYHIEVVLHFPGEWCQQAAQWVTTLGALEFRIGSACESYLAPPPGNDALNVSYTWSGLTNGNYASNISTPPDCDPYLTTYCLDCEQATTVDVEADLAEDEAGATLSIAGVTWDQCGPDIPSNNGAFFYRFRFQWDSDLAQWAIHHRGQHWLSGLSTYLTAAASPLVLVADPQNAKRGLPYAQHPSCGADPYICLNGGDLCESFPTNISLALAAI